VSTESLPSIVRVGALADLHFGRQGPDPVTAVEAAAAESDVIMICGDLTDHGAPEQARTLGRELSRRIRVPIVAVLGNHDFESDQAVEVQKILRDAGLMVLDGDACEVQGVAFAGTKGFCGGFGAHALGAWGEPIVKQFVQEAVGEALKLETALARIRTRAPIVLLHYAPIAATVRGEPEAIYPYLGSSRLAEPLGRYDVSAVFHGHAHHGELTGKIASGVPVFNVSLPLLQRMRQDRPFEIFHHRPPPNPDAPAARGTAGADSERVPRDSTPVP
jgi:Icc-related predicted phosphoesterase